MPKEVYENKCAITFRHAEGISSGFVWLTDDEYDVVKRVLDPRNWENSVVDKYSGCVTITKLAD